MLQEDIVSPETQPHGLTVEATFYDPYSTLIVKRNLLVALVMNTGGEEEVT